MSALRGLMSVLFCAIGATAFGQAPQAPSEPNRLPADAAPAKVPSATIGNGDAGFSGNWRPPAGWSGDGSYNRTAAENQPLRSLSPTGSGPAALPAAAGSAQKLTPIGPRKPIAKVTSGSGSLPTDRGQIWREYDISPYTARASANNRPEQALVEWIMRETGYDAWHSEPCGILSAGKTTLRVYHTPQMQETVGELVDRFVNPETETQAFGLRVVTVGNPNWRTQALRILRPVQVQSPGVQAWLLAREDAALLVGELRKRSDFHEHSAPQLVVYNAQAANVSVMHPRGYVRNVLFKPEAWPGYEMENAQIHEGFAIDLNPLLSLDGRTIDAVIKCQVEQVEKMLPVTLDVPSQAAPRQKQQVEVPQMSSSRMFEKFRWPADQVLLISLGVVASPTAADGNPIKIPLVNTSPSRSDLLVFVESRGKVAQPPLVPGATAPVPPTTTASPPPTSFRR